jgi:DNA-binding phage protein
MTETKTIPWKTKDHLETAEDLTAYVQAVFEDGDPTLIRYALGTVSRSKAGQNSQPCRKSYARSARS